MRIEPTATTLGAVVTDIDLREEITTADADQLRAALDDRGVLAFPGQHLEDDDLVRVGRIWGDPYLHPITELLGSDEAVGVIVNDGDRPAAEVGELGFHTDYTYNHEIPDVALLRSVVAPPFGGNTVWADTRAAARGLDPAMRAQLAGMTAYHHVEEGMLEALRARYDAETVARFDQRFGDGQRHPVLAVHPRTQDEVLFVNWGFTRHLIGRPEGDGLLDELFAVFGDPAIQFEHSWTEGDLVIWDEHRTVHRGPYDFGTHRRELHRCTVGRHVPTAAAKLAV
ncbi:TauD/TfdA dioxygenase family protein [Candidatus Poriferisocius sp.]|uniref:TauD/TfdA dioxygenase family protein n=1 Tax=Candidatus Poriferisocius sp. TaxID=3101276 RepID=UPI003B5C5BE9